MISELTLLVAAGFGDVDASLLTKVLAIVVAVLGLFGSAGGIAMMWMTFLEKVRGKKPAAIEQPVRISQDDKAITRAEFDALKEDVRELDADLEKMEERILGAIKELGLEMRKSVDAVSKAAYEGRQKIWERISPIGERLAKVEAQVGTKTK